MFFECLASYSLNSDGEEFISAGYIKHSEPGNIDYP